MIHLDPDALGDPERRSEVRRAATLTALVGAAHAVLLTLSLVLIGNAPGPQSTDGAIFAYYSSSSSRLPVIVGLYVMPFAAITFLWFVVALRTWTSHSVRRQNVLLSNLQFASGILYVGLFSVGAAAASVLAASIQFANGTIDPVVARQFPQFGNALFMVFAIRMAAIFIFTTSNIGRHSGILPRWFVYAGYGAGLFLLLSITFATLLLAVFPAWLLLLSGVLLRRVREVPFDERG